VGGAAGWGIQCGCLGRLDEPAGGGHLYRVAIHDRLSPHNDQQGAGSNLRPSI